MTNLQLHNDHPSAEKKSYFIIRFITYNSFFYRKVLLWVHRANSNMQTCSNSWLPLVLGWKENSSSASIVVTRTLTCSEKRPTHHDKDCLKPFYFLSFAQFASLNQKYSSPVTGFLILQKTLQQKTETDNLKWFVERSGLNVDLWNGLFINRKCSLSH